MRDVATAAVDAVVVDVAFAVEDYEVVDEDGDVDDGDAGGAAVAAVAGGIVANEY